MERLKYAPTGKVRTKLEGSSCVLKWEATVCLDRIECYCYEDQCGLGRWPKCEHDYGTTSVCEQDPNDKSSVVKNFKILINFLC